MDKSRKNENYFTPTETNQESNNLLSSIPTLFLYFYKLLSESNLAEALGILFVVAAIIQNKGANANPFAKTTNLSNRATEFDIDTNSVQMEWGENILSFWARETCFEPNNCTHEIMYKMTSPEYNELISEQSFYYSNNSKLDNPYVVTINNTGLVTFDHGNNITAIPFIIDENNQLNQGPTETLFSGQDKVFFESKSVVTLKNNIYTAARLRPIIDDRFSNKIYGKKLSINQLKISSSNKKEISTELPNSNHHGRFQFALFHPSSTYKDYFSIYYTFDTPSTENSRVAFSRYLDGSDFELAPIATPSGELPDWGIGVMRGPAHIPNTPSTLTHLWGKSGRFKLETTNLDNDEISMELVNDNREVSGTLIKSDPNDTNTFIMPYLSSDETTPSTTNLWIKELTTSSFSYNKQINTKPVTPGNQAVMAVRAGNECYQVLFGTPPQIQNFCLNPFVAASRVLPLYSANTKTKIFSSDEKTPIVALPINYNGNSTLSFAPEHGHFISNNCTKNSSVDMYECMQSLEFYCAPNCPTTFNITLTLESNGQNIQKQIEVQRAPNQPPYLNVLIPQVQNITSEIYYLPFSNSTLNKPDATDPEGLPLNYQLKISTPNNKTKTIPFISESFRWDPISQQIKPGNCTLTFTASDGEAQTIEIVAGYIISKPAIAVPLETIFQENSDPQLFPIEIHTESPYLEIKIEHPQTLEFIAPQTLNATTEKGELYFSIKGPSQEVIEKSKDITVISAADQHGFEQVAIKINDGLNPEEIIKANITIEPTLAPVPFENNIKYRYNQNQPIKIDVSQFFENPNRINRQYEYSNTTTLPNNIILNGTFLTGIRENKEVETFDINIMATNYKGQSAFKNMSLVTGATYFSEAPNQYCLAGFPCAISYTLETPFRDQNITLNLSDEKCIYYANLDSNENRLWSFNNTNNQFEAQPQHKGSDDVDYVWTSANCHGNKTLNYSINDSLGKQTINITISKITTEYHRSEDDTKKFTGNFLGKEVKDTHQYKITEINGQSFEGEQRRVQSVLYQGSVQQNGDFELSFNYYHPTIQKLRAGETYTINIPLKILGPQNSEFEHNIAVTFNGNQDHIYFDGLNYSRMKLHPNTQNQKIYKLYVIDKLSDDKSDFYCSYFDPTYQRQNIPSYATFFTNKTSLTCGFIFEPTCNDINDHGIYAIQGGIKQIDPNTGEVHHKRSIRAFEYRVNEDQISTCTKDNQPIDDISKIGIGLNGNSTLILSITEDSNTYFEYFLDHDEYPNLKITISEHNKKISITGPSEQIEKWRKNENNLAIINPDNDDEKKTVEVEITIKNEKTPPIKQPVKIKPKSEQPPVLSCPCPLPIDEKLVTGKAFEFYFKNCTNNIFKFSGIQLNYNKTNGSLIITPLSAGNLTAFTEISNYFAKVSSKCSAIVVNAKSNGSTKNLPLLISALGGGFAISAVLYSCLGACCIITPIGLLTYSRKISRKLNSNKNKVTPEKMTPVVIIDGNDERQEESDPTPITNKLAFYRVNPQNQNPMDELPRRMQTS